MRSKISPLRDFLHRESASGLLLLVAAGLGLAVANSPLGSAYFKVLDWGFDIGSDSIYLKLTTLKVINYVLMTIFFFVVGLEIKREMTTGHLASVRKALLPFIAALGGMALPAGIYLMIAGDTNSRGWGVPVATDIALAVGLLGMIGSSVVPSLRSFLLGLAVIDDIGAILIIAFIYSTGIGLNWVLSSIGVVLIIVTARRIGLKHLLPYIVLGGLLWYCLYRSGIHATLAGVILGLMTPNIAKNLSGVEDIEDGNLTIIEWIEDRLHPWSSFVIVPIFAFANTGVVISINSIQRAIESPIAWGIFFGLVLGKPLGILISVLLANKLKIADYPKDASQRGVLATGSAAGIGFTVAIFIANLAFRENADQDLAIFAVIAASIVSGVISWVLFSVLAKKISKKN
jgi:NhaA family Na+:H+ antiporter